MTIPWTPRQKASVANVFVRHPPNSSRCKEAAKQILPIGRTVDQRARTMHITPRGGAPYIDPILPPHETIEKPWYHHYSTEVLLHYVDVLTGPDGTEIEDYRRKHWREPDWINIEAVKV